MKDLIAVIIPAFYMFALNAQPAKPYTGADMILFNAKIATQNLLQPEASKLAVKRERIYAVDNDAVILSLKDNNTKLIDADGSRLIPILNDAHVHVLNERNYNYNVRWDGVPTLKRALEMLSEHTKRTRKGNG
jgi:predicted amidohydrolase YtcJ